MLVVRVNVSGRFDVASGLMGFRSLWLGCSFLNEFFYSESTDKCTGMHRYGQICTGVSPVSASVHQFHVQK